MSLFASTLFIVGAFAGHSCTRNDMCGAGEKCYYGECTVSHGPGNMCGGPSDADACFECFECNKHETGCVPISGCESSVCEEDSDCERGQICYNNDCALPDKIPGSCTGRSSACNGLAFYYCKSDTACRWDDDYDNGAGMGAKRRGGKGNRGGGSNRGDSDDEDDASWGGPALASLESEEKGLSYDGHGNIEYDEDGYAVLTEYAEMCGGKNADEECYECFECSRGGNRCIPISDCVPSCEVDEDCTREQICVDGENVCRLEGGRPGGAGMGAARKGGKGNRGYSDDDGDSSWGGPAVSAFTIASLESDKKGLSYDADGNIEYDEDGYALLVEYAEMCGGRNADQECYECFECSSGGNRCIPIEGCIPSCEVDDDCTREQVCEEDSLVCRLPGGRPCGGYGDSEDCDDAGRGASRKGGKGNRGNGNNDDDSDSSWGGPSLSAHASMSLASMEEEQKGFSLDADGNIEYDEDGYALLVEYAEMCGGKNADQECYECFECGRNGDRCIPVSGCVPTCEVDEDCTREQICVEGEDVCRLEGGRPGGYRDSEDNGAGMGSERKGGKGNRGSSSDEDDSSSWGGPVRKEAVVMKNGMLQAEATQEQSQSVSYLVLLWCSIAAVLSFAAAWLVKYWRRTEKFEETSAARSSHMVIGDQVYY